MGDINLNLSTVNLVAAVIGAIGVGLIFSTATGMLQGLFSRLGGKAASRVDALFGDRDEDPFRVTALEGQPILDRLLGSALTDTARWVGTAVGTADRDGSLLLQAGFPPPFKTLGDFYGWKVISAFLLFVVGTLVAAMTGAVFFVFVAFAFGVFGLYMPDLTLRQEAKRRQEAFRAELAFLMDQLGMMLGAGKTPQDALRRLVGEADATGGAPAVGRGGVAEDTLREVAKRSGGILTLKLRQVVEDLDAGRRSLVEALKAVEQEFPLEEYRGFVEAIALSVEQGAPLVTTLADMSDSLQTDLENELLARGLRGNVNMVVYMGLAMINIFILILVPLMALWI